MTRLLVIIISVLVIISGSSCVNIKSFQYLQGGFDTARIGKVQIPEPVIQKGDLLGITVYSDDPLSTAAVIRGGSSSVSLSGEGSSNTGNAPVTGYQVNQSGKLQLYKLGFIEADGLTREQLADTLEYLYAKEGLLKNPYVEVRFLNFKVTVIGEVSKPGSYSLPVEKISAFDVIGLAGDITPYGRKDNVLVIREANGVRRFGHLNFKDPNVFLSPYFYLQQNDLVIVDVAKNKSSINNQYAIQTISVGASLISVLAVVYSIINNN